jgi:serine/threonine protein kinase
MDFEFVNTIRKVSEVRNPWDFAQIGPLLGKGNSGSVIKALNLEDYKIYALKRVYVTSQANRSQMLKEVNAFSVLKSEHLVSNYGSIVEDDEPEEITLVLEYMNRGSLQNVIDTCGPVTDEKSLGRIAKMVLLGLNDMHKMNLIHRDIKPGNIVLNHKGEVKLTDFGITRKISADAFAQPVNTFVGTQVYMSPERIEHKPYSFASDIWSLGLTVLTLATGSLPYNGVNSGGFAYLFYALTQLPAPALPEKFSAEFSDFIAKCLIKEAELRWSAEDLLSHPFLKDVDTSEASFDGWPWDIMDEKKMIQDQNDIQEIAEILREISLTSTVDSTSTKSVCESGRTSNANSQVSVSPKATAARKPKLGKVLENSQYESIADTLGVQNVRMVQILIDAEFCGFTQRMI